MVQEEDKITDLEEKLFKVVSAFKPKIFKINDEWCCQADDVCGYGINPMNAIYNFYNSLYKHEQ